MTDCPFCAADNIDGVDTCEQCGQSIDFLTKLRPQSELERGILKGRVADLRPRRPLSVDVATPVRDVLKKLAEHSIGCVNVTDQGELAGIFTERDALMRLNTRYAELGDRPVSEFMTASPESVDCDASIAFALHKMDLGGYRHIPVLTDGEMTGIISVRDILRFVTEDLIAAGSK